MQSRSNERATDVVTLSSDPNEVHEGYDAARAKGPVVTVSFTGPADDPDLEDFLTREHLFVTRYDEVLAALVDNRLSSDRRSVMTEEQRQKLPPVVEEFRLLSESLLSMDPPDHTRLRKLIQPSFSPRVIEAMRPRIRNITEDLLDAAERAAEARGESAPDRRLDLIDAFAYPMPVTVISDMLGIPPEDRPQVRLWTENLLKGDRRRFGTMDAETRAKMREFTTYLRELFVVKREKPAEDMITELLRAEEEGDKLNEDEVLSTVFILYLAGHVTTVNLIGNGVFALLRHPTELAKLKADPGLSPKVPRSSRRRCGIGGRSISSRRGLRRKTSSSAARASGKASPSWWGSPRPTVILRVFRIPMRTTSRARAPSVTSHSAKGFTSAWARRSRGSRGKSRSRR